MALMFGLICGILCGAALGFVVGLFSLIPYLGWMYHLTTPTFVVGTVVCTMYIGLKAERTMGI